MTDIIHMIRRKLSSMPSIQKRLGAFILDDPQKITGMTMRELSRELNISEGSIINFSVRLGLDGFSALKIAVARSFAVAQPLIYEETKDNDDTRDIVHKVRDNALDAIRATCDCITDDEIQSAARVLMFVKKRIEVYATGSTAIIAEDAAFRLLKLGLPAAVVKDSYIAAVCALTLDSDCVALAISYTGRSKDLLKTMTIAKEKGAKTICITCYADSPLAQLCDIPIVVVSGEAVVNKLATVSRMAQLVVVDMICEYIASKCKDMANRKQDEIINAWGDYWIEEGRDEYSTDEK